MSAQLEHAPVTYLEPVPDPVRSPVDPRDQALAELAIDLDTQRSAGKAMLGAVKELERRLVGQREVAAELEARNQSLEAQMVEYATAVSEQVAENKRLWCDVRIAEHRLAEELDKPAWRRLFNR